MKFEALQFKPNGNEPDSLNAFFAHYALVNRFLTRFNLDRLTSTENIANYSVSLTLPHGTISDIPHNLSFVPTTVSCSGRVEFYEVVARTVKTVSVRFKLHTVDIVTLAPNRPQNRIEVSDVTFLNPNDYVKIGNVVRKIIGIDKNLLILDQNVIYDNTVRTISLATTVVSVFIF